MGTLIMQTYVISMSNWNESKRSVPNSNNVSIYQELLEKLSKLTKDLSETDHL